MTMRTLVVLWVVQLIGCGSDSTFVVAEADAEAQTDATSSDAATETSGAEAATTDSGTVTADTTSPGQDIGVACTDLSAKAFGGHCYFPLTPMEWPDAKKACEAKGAYLVVITSAGEHTFVSAFGGLADRWIGLERAMGSQLLKENFGWVTGEQNLIDRWALTEPNGSGLCGELRPDGMWGDALCTSSFPALCERE